MRTVLLAALLLLPLAGCFEDTFGRQPNGCPVPLEGDIIASDAWGFEANDGQPTDLLYLAQTTEDRPGGLRVNVTDGNETFSQSAAVYGDGAPVPFEDIRFTPPAGDRHFGALRLDSDTLGAGIVMSFRYLEHGLPERCALAGGLTINWGVQVADSARRAAAPGQGAHVLYAGFWADNGTLFDTNLQDIDIGSGWPRADWYDGNHWDPIPVYVYDQDASEQPAYWKSASANGQAVAPARPILAAADQETGAGYFPTIKGFNEAVKGLPIGTRQAFLLAPEDAYTRAGREDHPLYGAALVFLVEVIDVVDAPCPTPPLAGATPCSLLG